MKKKTILFLMPVLALALLLTGCGKNASELATEKIIENNLGGKADVNIENDSVKIETDQGNWQAGEGSSLPESWPDDVYVPDGKIVIASDTGFSKGVTIELDKGVTDLRDEYKEKITEEAWEITMELNVEGSVMLGAKKDNRNLSVSISNEDDKTTMTITFSEQQ